MRGNTPIVLCVEDDLILLKSLQIELEMYFGNRLIIEIAESVEEAFEVLDTLMQEGSEIIAAISDHQMIPIDGITFFEQLSMKFPQIYKILLTGNNRNELIQQSLPVHEILEKPWNSFELASKIEKLLHLQ